MSRLLVLACSQRKRKSLSVLPAIDRYDGPAFRVLRRFRRLNDSNGLVVSILSAEFGLISAKKPIAWYDRQMTTKRADDLRPDVARAAQRAIKRHRPSEIFICAGKTYLRALNSFAEKEPRVSFANGGQGRKLASLKAWLHEG